MPKGAIGFSATQKATDIARNSVTKRIPGMPGEALALEYRPKPSPNKPTRWPLLGAAYHRLRLIETLAWTSAHDERRDIGKLQSHAPVVPCTEVEECSTGNGFAPRSRINHWLCDYWPIVPDTSRCVFLVPVRLAAANCLSVDAPLLTF